MEAFRSTAVSPGGPTEARRHRRTGAIVALIVALLVGLGAGLFVLAKRGGDDKVIAATDPGSGALAQAGSAALIATPTPAPTPAPPAQAGVPIDDPPPPVAKRAQPPPTVRANTDHGAVIVNGGSAADHGVHIGDNVHIGSNVIIGSQTPAPPTTGPAKSVTRAADYDAKHFDPVAFLPKAEALAKQLAPDAHLTRFEFDPVFPDGHVDLTMDGRDHEYDFRSVEHSARPTDLPRNVPFERPCMIHIEVEATKVVATVRSTEDCSAKLVRAPHCRFAGVWAQAKAKGTATDIVARIAWLSDEAWFFDIDLEGKGGGVSTLPDRCP
jgi:hypothetical protein